MAATLSYIAPEFQHSALITIDVQCDFLDGGTSTIPGTSAVLPQITLLAKAFRVARRPVVHMVRIYQPDGSNAERSRRAALESGSRIVLPNTSGMELAPELLPPGHLRLNTDLLLSGEAQDLGPAEWAMFKPRWGAFFRTKLEAMLHEMGVTTLIFCGCNFPNCPRTSIYEASERDFRIALAEDAVSGLYERGRSELTGIGVATMAAEEIARHVTNLVSQAG